MGEMKFFLGIKYSWSQDSHGNISVHLSQEAFIDALVADMGLDARKRTAAKTPHRLGLSIDNIPENSNISANQRQYFVHLLQY